MTKGRGIISERVLLREAQRKRIEATEKPARVPSGQIAVVGNPKNGLPIIPWGEAK